MVQRGLDKVPLDTDAPDVCVGIAAAEADQAHGFLAVELLQPRVQGDMQVLGRVVVVHIRRHIEFHAAEQIDQLDKDIQVHQNVAVGPEADALSHIVHQGIHAGGRVPLGTAVAGIGRVDLMGRVGGIDLGVPGDAHQIQLPCPAVNLE